jgi:hypothetical protein
LIAIFTIFTARHESKHHELVHMKPHLYCQT